MKAYSKIVEGIFLLCCFLPGCDTFNDDGGINVNVFATASFSYEVPVANQTEVRLEGINGTVDVSGIPGATTVEITGERRVGSNSRRDAEEYLRRVKVELIEGSDVILIRTDQPENSHGREFTINYNITMPSELAATIQHINGAVTVHDVRSGTEVGLINGIIFCSGELPSEGPIDLQTINGRIELEIPTESSAELSASVVNGSIRTSNLTLTDPVVTPRTLTGKLGDGEMEINLQTVNGDIVIRGI